MQLSNPQRYAVTMLDLYGHELRFTVEVDPANVKNLVEAFESLGCKAVLYDETKGWLQVDTSAAVVPSAQIKMH